MEEWELNPENEVRKFVDLQWLLASEWNVEKIWENKIWFSPSKTIRFWQIWFEPWVIRRKSTVALRGFSFDLKRTRISSHLPFACSNTLIFKDFDLQFALSRITFSTFGFSTSPMTLFPNSLNEGFSWYSQLIGKIIKGFFLISGCFLVGVWTDWPSEPDLLGDPKVWSA